MSSKVILTDDSGADFSKPKREDYATVQEYALAFYRWKDRITHAANSAFDARFRELMR